MALFAIAGVVMLSIFSTSYSSGFVMDKVYAEYNPMDYQLENGCYLAFEQKERILPGKRIRIISENAAESYQYYIDRGYEECGIMNQDDIKNKHHYLCPQMTKCMFKANGYECVQRYVNKIELCD